jgi:hypothetical protein
MISILSCANPYIGKSIPGGNFNDVSYTNHHRAEYEHLILDYDCVVDDENIIFDGTVEIVWKSFAKNWDIKQVNFLVYFLDDQKTIVDAKQMYIYFSDTRSAQTTFKKKFKKNPDFKYVGFTYDLKAYL